MSRVLMPKMRSFFHRQWGENPLWKAAIAKKAPTTVMLMSAQGAVGRRELTGNNDGLFVELTQMTVDGKDVREPYCIAGAMTCVAMAEEETGIKSRLPASEHCMTCWRATPADMKIPREKIRPGDHVCWNKVGTDSGHWGIVEEVHKDHMVVLEYNTTSGTEDGEIVREGGGVYRVKRSYGQIGNMKLVGFIRPF